MSRLSSALWILVAAIALVVPMAVPGCTSSDDGSSSPDAGLGAGGGMAPAPAGGGAATPPMGGGMAPPPMGGGGAMPPPMGEFTCSDDEVIQAGYVCDCDDDCSDGGDEANCPDLECREPVFQCADGAQTIPEDNWCDGTAECADGSDEVDCPVMFTCADGEEIDGNWQCDGEIDCADASDELDCPDDTPRPHMCGDGSYVDADWVCDGEADCADESDEPADCRTCNDGSPIAPTWFCDGEQDCAEGEDEIGCPDGGMDTP